MSVAESATPPEPSDQSVPTARALDPDDRRALQHVLAALEHMQAELDGAFAALRDALERRQVREWVQERVASTEHQALVARVRAMRAAGEVPPDTVGLEAIEERLAELPSQQRS